MGHDVRQRNQITEEDMRTLHVSFHSLNSTDDQEMELFPAKGRKLNGCSLAHAEILPKHSSVGFMPKRTDGCWVCVTMLKT